MPTHLIRTQTKITMPNDSTPSVLPHISHNPIVNMIFCNLRSVRAVIILGFQKCATYFVIHPCFTHTVSNGKLLLYCNSSETLQTNALDIFLGFIKRDLLLDLGLSMKVPWEDPNLFISTRGGSGDSCAHVTKECRR